MEYSNKINRICWGAFLIRITVLLLIFLFQKELGLYFMPNDVFHDDEKYVTGALGYADQAKSLIDVSAFISAMGDVGYYAEMNVEGGWFLFTSLFMYIFHNVWLLRLVNILFAIISIYLLYKFAYKIYGKKVALNSARLLAFLPYPVFFCCFPFKDHFVMMLLLCGLNVAYDLVQDNNKILKRIVILALLITIIHFFRRGLDALLLLFSFYYYVTNIQVKGKLSNKILIYSILVIVVFFLGNVFFEEVSHKLTAYSAKDYSGSRIMSLIAVEHIYDIWRLPFALAFSILLPFDLNQPLNTWYGIVSNINVIMMPFAIANVIYMFKPKKDKFLYWGLLSFYFAVIIMSLTIFRHYYCLLPISLLFFSNYWNGIRQKQRSVVYGLSAILIMMAILVYKF